jgi:5-formyltetrahydrofolate cyclo-ligase
MQAWLRTPDPEMAEAAAHAAAARLVALPEYASARRVALYAALPNELGTRPLFAAVRGAGKAALFPRANPKRRVLEFIAAARWEELELGRYGVREPPAGTSVLLEPGDLVVVPGLAFDAAGHRLGRGAGWFDRTLTRTDRLGPLLIGYAYERQVVESVPSGPTDRCVDWIVTEQAVRRASAAERGK